LIEIGSKTAEKNSAQTNRHYEMPNFVEIGQTTAEVWRFFRFFKMAAAAILEAAAILDFQNLKLLTVERLERAELRRRSLGREPIIMFT